MSISGAGARGELPCRAALPIPTRRKFTGRAPKRPLPCAPSLRCLFCLLFPFSLLPPPPPTRLAPSPSAPLLVSSSSSCFLLSASLFAPDLFPFPDSCPRSLVPFWLCQTEPSAAARRRASIGQVGSKLKAAAKQRAQRCPCDGRRGLSKRARPVGRAPKPGEPSRKRQEAEDFGADGRRESEKGQGQGRARSGRRMQGKPARSTRPRRRARGLLGFADAPRLRPGGQLERVECFARRDGV